MTKEQDGINRAELKKLIDNIKLDESLKQKLLIFAEELENGKLEQLLKDIKQKLQNN